MSFEKLISVSSNSCTTRRLLSSRCLRSFSSGVSCAARIALFARVGSFGGSPWGESGLGAARCGGGGAALPTSTESLPDTAAIGCRIAWLRSCWNTGFCCIFELDSRFEEEFEREGAGGAVTGREAPASSSSLPINGFLSDSGVSTRGGVLGGVGVLGAGECVFMGGGLGGCLKELDESRDDATAEPAVDVGWGGTDLGTDAILLLLLKIESIDIREEGNVDDGEVVF